MKTVYGITEKKGRSHLRKTRNHEKERRKARIYRKDSVPPADSTIDKFPAISSLSKSYAKIFFSFPLKEKSTPPVDSTIDKFPANP
ncbi:MAG: hypothetical protein JW904_06035 [Spirochaetales bacterium]|nr:hypothetical protein [Spirochaetales bacterium]